jgi:hypothetical protein
MANKGRSLSDLMGQNRSTQNPVVARAAQRNAPQLPPAQQHSGVVGEKLSNAAGDAAGEALGAFLGAESGEGISAATSAASDSLSKAFFLESSK